MVFLPRTDFSAHERCRHIVESEILRFGHRIYGWRQVPTNVEAIGEKANATRPEIEQIMVENARHVDDVQFEVDLYIIRRRIAKEVGHANICDSSILSLHSRSVIFNGVFLAQHHNHYYS